ncbi:MAG: MFS transporter, partial [Zoogloeaceae bacterium]|nr:MFS transporter [Zoogloeaceae bacterium]
MFTRKMLICVFTGFSSGLPFFLLLQLVPAWMKTCEVDISTIGLLTLTTFPFIWKFLWAPLLDRYTPPLGRRRGWMLASQVMLLVLIGALGHFSPQSDMFIIVNLLVLLAFCAATQDIAIDAYRREILSDSDLGLGNSVHINAYRVAGLIPGSLSLILADRIAWDAVFWITALFMLPGMAMALLVREPHVKTLPRSLEEACVQPFLEFIRRQGWQGALLVLSFLFLYKLGDSLATALATPFYMEMNFSKTDIGLIAKHAGLWPAVIGAIVGGLIMKRIGINRALWIFGAIQIAAIFGFVWLSWIGPFQPPSVLPDGTEVSGITLENRIALAV